MLAWKDKSPSKDKGSTKRSSRLKYHPISFQTEHVTNQQCSALNRLRASKRFQPMSRASISLIQSRLLEMPWKAQINHSLLLKEEVSILLKPRSQSSLPRPPSFAVSSRVSPKMFATREDFYRPWKRGKLNKPFQCLFVPF